MEAAVEIALGRRSRRFKSATFTPATFSSMVKEKKAIAAVMAKRGCIKPATDGASCGDIQSLTLRTQLLAGAGAAFNAGAFIEVTARMLCTRFAGGSTSSS